MSTHPRQDSWLLLVDGQLAEDQATEMRRHAARCPTCHERQSDSVQLVKRLGGGALVPVSAELKAELFGRLPKLSAATGRRVPWLALALGGAALGLAAGFVVAHVPSLDDRGFAARGGPSGDAFERQVGVSFHVAGTQLQALEPGAAIAADAALVTRARNLSHATAYLVVVAVDAAGRAQWVQPGEGARAAVPVPSTDVERALPETVILEAPARGPLQLLSVLSPVAFDPAELGRPLPAGLSAASLARQFPRAAVASLPLVVR